MFVENIYVGIGCIVLVVWVTDILTVGLIYYKIFKLDNIWDNI